MDERDGTGQAPQRRAVRRLRAVPGDLRADVPTAHERDCEALGGLRRPVLSAVGEGADAPRVAALDALLKDVDDLRASVRRDLGLAATAVEAGEDDLVAFLLDRSTDDLRDFEDRADGRLADLADVDAPGLPVAVGADDPGPGSRLRTRRLAPAAPLVAAAAALFVGLSGGVPALSGGATTASGSAGRSLASLSDLIEAGATAEQLGAAADQLHDELVPLLPTASSDPQAAQEAIDLLNRETAVLLSSADTDHPEVRQAIADAQALVRMLKRAVNRPSVKAGLPPVKVEQPEPKPEPSPSSAPSSAKPAPKPSSSPSSKPSSTPSSTPSSSPSSAPSSSPSGSSEESEDGRQTPVVPDLD